MNAYDVGVFLGKRYVVTMGSRILIKALGFIYQVVIARLLNPAGFGILALVTTIMSIFSLAFSLGLPTAITRHIGRSIAKKEDPGKALSAVSGILISSALVASVLLFILAEPLASRVFHNPEATTPFRIASVAVFAAMVGNISAAILNGFLRLEYVALANVVQAVTKLLASVALLLLGFEVLGAVWGLVAGMVALSAVYYICGRRFIHFKPGFGNRKASSEILRTAVPLYGAQVVDMVQGQATVLLTPFFLTTSDLAFFTVAAAVPAIITAFTNPLHKPLLSAYTQAHTANDTRSLQQMFNRSLKYTYFLLIPATAGAFILAQPLVTTLYGRDFLPAAAALKILGFGALLTTISIMGSYYMIAVGKPVVTLWMTILGAAVGLASSALLIPRYGIEGAALATLVTQAIVASVLFFLFRNPVKFNGRFLPKTLLATGVMCALIWFIRLRSPDMGLAVLLATVAAGAVLYFSVLYAIGGLDAADKRLLKDTVTSFARRRKGVKP